MVEGRAWRFQADAYALAGTLHCLLFGEYMAIERAVDGSGESHYPCLSLCHLIDLARSCTAACRPHGLTVAARPWRSRCMFAGASCFTC